MINIEKIEELTEKINLVAPDKHSLNLYDDIVDCYTKYFTTNQNKNYLIKKFNTKVLALEERLKGCKIESQYLKKKVK